MNVKADYSKAYNTVLEVIKKYNINTIPISLKSLIKKMPILRLCPYSKAIKGRDCSLRDFIDFLGSDLGAYVKYGNLAIIYFNDTKRNRGLDRFTIAHELGHHFLGHAAHLTYGEVLRRGLPDREYEAVEKEANCFARNLLAPMYLLHMIGIAPDDVMRVQNTFNISKTAAKTRLQTYSFDQNAFSVYGSELIMAQFDKHIKFHQFVRVCRKCKNVFSIKGARYCPLCGSPKLKNYEGEKINMKYDGLNVDENKKLLKCVKCDNEDVSEGDYCKICGAYLINRCSNYPEPGNYRSGVYCGIPLPGDARYCFQCGHESTFYIDGNLKDWETSQKEAERAKQKAEDELFFKSEKIPF